MADYEDLFNMTDAFKNTKYIIHAKPAVVDSVSEEIDIKDALGELGIYLTKSFNKQLDEVQSRTKLILKNQNSKIHQIQKTLNNYMNRQQVEQKDN